jgi:hypothetical protein
MYGKICFMGKAILLFLMLMAVCAPSVTLAVFDRDLKLGDSGEDVRLLQVMLNKFLDSPIALSGVGSKGLESSYFGLLTKQAVIRFQEKYADLILKPASLTKGTGYVGASTRGVLKEFYGSGETGLNANIISEIQKSMPVVVPVPPPMLANSNLSGSESNTLSQLNVSKVIKINSIEPENGIIGTQVIIKGEGFSTKTANDVYIGGHFEKIKSSDGKTLKITIENPMSFHEYDFDSGFDVFFGIGSGLSGTILSVMSKIRQENDIMGDKLIIPVGIFVKNTEGSSNLVAFNLEF